MGDKNSKPKDGAGEPKSASVSPVKGTQEYDAMVRTEQEKMLMVSTAPAEAPQGRPESAILDKLDALEKIEPLVDRGKDVKGASLGKALDADDVVQILAALQTWEKGCNATVSATVAKTAQGMKDCKQLCDTLDKKVAHNNAALQKLQGDLADVSRLQRAVEQATAAAMKCADLVDDINALVLQKETAAQDS
eukprot:TRINITY_DN12399_c0_g1_i2.p1 TRINITY_DN12399_c0_g1~~TRINITY_DN12399_c0_g1_i2.p1  ORF type:complete len:211 (+),score=92.02 TRINITY_DN12399_c0_g1_i2:59-634(+)